MKGEFSITELNGRWSWSVQAGTRRIAGGSYETRAACVFGMLYQLSLSLLEELRIG